MQKKPFLNKKTKRRKLGQLVAYFTNNFGTNDKIKTEKSDKDLVKAVKAEGLEEEYKENKDIK